MKNQKTNCNTCKHLWKDATTGETSCGISGRLIREYDKDSFCVNFILRKKAKK